MLIGAALVLCILSVPLLGGRLHALAELEFRRGGLAVAALVVQVVIISLLPGDAWGLSEEIHLATYFMLGAFLVANRHIPGLLVIALGGALNFAAIATNGGVMPADPDAIEAAGIPQKAGDFINSAPASDAPLGFLGDIFHTPALVPHPQRLQRRRHRDRARRLPAPALRLPLAARRRAPPPAARGGMRRCGRSARR